MKKILSLALMLILVLSLAACETTPPTTGGNPSATTQPTTPSTTSTTAPKQPTKPTTAPTSPVHVHTPNEQWLVDKADHWQVCTDCGERMNESAHTLEYGFCTQCEAEVYISDYDGSATVYLYDAQGNSIFALEYDVDGNLLCTYTWEYTYDEAGNTLSMKQYADGVLNYEETYSLSADGEFYFAAKSTYYAEDGSTEYNEYDQWGNTTLWICYDAEGAMAFSARYEYIMDNEGNILNCKTYAEDVLTFEQEYTLVEDPDGYYSYCSRDITYYDDGSRLITEYDENSEVLSEVYLDSNGNPVDHSTKFNTELCAPLFGQWYCAYTVTSEESGIATDVRAEISLFFSEDGQLSSCLILNKEDMKLASMELMYTIYESSGITRDQVDAMFQAEYGMSLEAYVELYLESEEGRASWFQESDQVYYVEGDKIYAGNSWNTVMEPVQFILDGDTLTLINYNEETGESLVLTRVAE